MNRLSVKTIVKEEDDFGLITEILIDGELLLDFEKYVLSVDLAELRKSTQETGEFFIITCTCGQPECAGIKEGIRVSRDSKNILWVVPKSLVDPTRTFSFPIDEYVTAVENGIKQFKQMFAKYQSYAYPPVNKYRFGGK